MGAVADGKKSSDDQFRVFTRTYANGQPRDVESVIPLHPKVRAYLEREAHHRWYKIYDRLDMPLVGFPSPKFGHLKVYYVAYDEITALRLGADYVMVFDQITGELLHTGMAAGD